MEKTTYVSELQVKGIDGEPIDLELHLSPTGGYFTVDTSFIIDVSDRVYDPFGNRNKVILEDPTQEMLDETE